MQIKRSLRAHLESSGFSEVECGVLQASPGNEAHLHAFSTVLEGSDGSRSEAYLHASPEFAAKKLLAAGETRIFEFARVFRNRERGALHAPEFTMLEWYRAREEYGTVQDDCLAILKCAAGLGAGPLRYRDRVCDAFQPPERLQVMEAFRMYAGVDLIATLDDEGRGDRDGLATRARRAGLSVAADDTWSDIFSKLLAAVVEPRLGLGRPTILYEYPRCEAALARATRHDPRLAERFEIYACGVELANGFGELIDVAEQRARFVEEMNEMKRMHGKRYPLDEDFLDALAGMPPASGVALGFDRLVMLVAGAPRIEDVIWTPLGIAQ